MSYVYDKRGSNFGLGAPFVESLTAKVTSEMPVPAPAPVPIYEQASQITTAPAPAPSGGVYQVTNTISGSQRTFYRLVK